MTSELTHAAHDAIPFRIHPRKSGVPYLRAEVTFPRATVAWLPNGDGELADLLSLPAVPGLPPLVAPRVYSVRLWAIGATFSCELSFAGAVSHDGWPIVDDEAGICVRPVYEPVWHGSGLPHSYALADRPDAQVPFRRIELEAAASVAVPAATPTLSVMGSHFERLVLAVRRRPLSNTPAQLAQLNLHYADARRNPELTNNSARYQYVREQLARDHSPNATSDRTLDNLKRRGLLGREDDAT